MTLAGRLLRRQVALESAEIVGITFCLLPLRGRQPDPRDCHGGNIATKDKADPASWHLGMPGSGNL